MSTNSQYYSQRGLTQQSEFEAAPLRTAPRAVSSSQLGARRSQTAVQRNRAVHSAMMRTIALMTPHIKRQNGRLRFTLPARTIQEAASRLGAKPKIVANLLRSLRRRNERAQAGSGNMREFYELNEVSELDLESSTCPGSTAIKPRWWGQEIWLNECHTQALIYFFTAGAAAGGGCAAAFPHPAVKAGCGAVFGIAGVSAAALNAIDSLGGRRGIIIYNPVLGYRWVWHQ